MNEQNNGLNGLYEKYLDILNKKIFPKINYACLEKSYKSPGMEYAKEVLKKLHDAFVEVYGSDYLDNTEYGEYGFVLVPAVIMSKNKKRICVGLLELDLDSSGEHWDTIFLCKYGVVSQHQVYKKDAGKTTEKDHLKRAIKPLFPYEYWYTVRIENDIHIHFDRICEKARALLSGCRKEN